MPGCLCESLGNFSIMWDFNINQENYMNQETTKQELQKLLDSLVNKNAGIRNGLAAVSTGDEMFHWSGAAGLANPAKKIPMTVETSFYIASITKMLTATVIMLLYEQKKLGLGDPMSKYLPESLIEGIHVYEGTEYTKQVQIRHLLSHTSGIADYYLEKPPGGKSFFELLLAEEATERTVEDTIVRAREKLSANFVPGEKASYSDTNYQLLGFIIESVTGNPLHEVFQGLLFEPLDMPNTYLYTRSEPRTPPSKAIAHIYYKDIDLTYNDALKTSWADGGIISTMADCLRFLKALNRGGIFQDDGTLAMMHKWRKLEFPIRYGFGTMSMKLPRIFSPFNPIPEIKGHFGSTGTCLFFCEELDFYLVGATNQVESQTKLSQLLIGIIKLVKKLER
jgi:CubicO group peptidase (beta-lactamase class C family)